MNVEQKSPNEFVIVLDDVFDFKRVEEFRRCYESIDGTSTHNIAIDFSRTRYMDSSALGMLLNVKSYFKSTNVALKITSVNEQIRKILTISRFDQRFIIE